MPIHQLSQSATAPYATYARRSSLMKSLFGRGFGSEQELQKEVPNLFAALHESSGDQDSRAEEEYLTVRRTHRPLRGWRQRGKKSATARPRGLAGPLQPPLARRSPRLRLVRRRRPVPWASTGPRQAVRPPVSVDSG